MATKQCYPHRELLTRLALVPSILDVSRIDILESPSPTVKKGYVSLFDGKSLNGWHRNEQKISHVLDGKGQLTVFETKPNAREHTWYSPYYIWYGVVFFLTIKI